MLEDNTDFTWLCHFLTREERLQLFDMLCGSVQKRIPERVSMELGIKRPNVYPYMKGREKRLVPNAETTVKIVNALRERGHNQRILPVLKKAFELMKIVMTIYRNWIEKREKINSPFSDEEYHRLERSLDPNLMHY
jgi:hypothetical protein